MVSKRKLKVTDCATISSITRESASTIGRSLNTIISRYESIKKTGFNSEDATGINDVVKALSDVGIIATDSQGQLRNFTDVMDELGAKFKTLDKNEQAYVTTALFGTYQRNRGLTLLNNYNQSLGYYEEALNSAGTAEEKFAIYQESTQARIDNLTASMEEFWQNLVNSDAIKSTLTFLTELINKLDVLINNSFSQFIIQVTLLTTAVYGLTLAYGKLSVAMATASMSGPLATIISMFKQTIALKLGIKALTAELLASPLFKIALIATAIVGAIKLFDALTISIEEQKEKLSELKSEISGLQSEYEQLLAKENRTSEEEKYLKLLEKELEIKKQLEKIDTENLVKKEFFDTPNQLSNERGGYVYAQSGAEKIKYDIEKLNRLKSEYGALLNEPISFTGNEKQQNAAAEKRRNELEKLNIEILNLEESLSSTGKTLKGYNDVLDNSDPKIVALYDAILQVIEATDKQNNSFESISKQSDDYASSLSKVNGYEYDLVDANKAVANSNFDIQKSYKDISDGINKYTSEVSELSDAYESLASGEGLSTKQVLDLVSKYPQLISSLKDVNGQITLNKDGIAALMDIKEKEFRTSLELTILDLKNQKDALFSRLGMYTKEGEAIKTVAEAKLALAKMYEIDDVKDQQAAQRRASTIGEISVIEAQIATLRTLQNTNLKTGLSGSSKPKSGSSSSDTAKPDYIDPTQSIINAYNATYQQQDKIISKYEEKLSLLEKEKNYVTDIEEKNKLINQQYEITNRLIAAQTKKISDIKEANYNISNQAKYLRDKSAYGKDALLWFDSNGEETQYYVEKYSKSSETVQKQMQELFNKLQLLKKAFAANQEEIKKAEQSLTDYKYALIDLKANIADDIISIIKETIQEEIDAIDDLMDEEQDRHDERIKNIEKERDAFNDAIDDQLAAIDRLNDTEDYNKQLSKAQQQRQGIQSQISIAMLDTSPAGKARLVELQKELVEKQEEIDELILNRQRDLRKENLEDQKDEYNEDVENKIESEKDKFNAVKKSLDKQKQALQDQLNDERAFAKLREDIIDGNLSAINKSFAGFEGLISDNSKGLGKALQRYLIDNLEDAKDLLEELDEMLGGDGKSSSNTPSKVPSGWTKSGSNYKKTMDGQVYSVSPEGYIYKNNNFVTTGNYKYLPSQVLDVARDRKAGFYKDGGLITTPTAIVGEAGKEAVFNMPQLQNLFDMLRNPFKYQVPKVNVPSFAGAGGNGVVNYNLNLRIDNITGDKTGGQTVFNEIVTGLKKLGKM